MDKVVRKPQIPALHRGQGQLDRKSPAEPTGPSRGLKRYNLVMPEELFDELQRVADERHTTVVELLRKFTRLGLMALQLENKPDAALLVREGDMERQIVMF